MHVWTRQCPWENIHVCLTPKPTIDPNRHRCLRASCPFLQSQSPRDSNRGSCKLLSCIFMCYLVLWASESSAEITLENRLHVRREGFLVSMARNRCLTRTRRFRVVRSEKGRWPPHHSCRNIRRRDVGFILRSIRNIVPVLQDVSVYVFACGL